MNRKYARNIILGLLSVLLWRCDSEDPNIKHTETEALAGEWYVTYTLNGSDFNGGYSRIITANTAANVANEILVSDYVEPNAARGNFWSYKIKAQVDPAGGSFTADEVTSSASYDGDPYPVKVNILNGKVMPGKGRSKTGVVVDSIYFEIQFEDDTPAFGRTYVATGHKRTGFHADDY